MDISKLLPFDKRAHIISVIEKAASFGGDAWQNHPKGRKVFHLVNIEAGGLKSDNMFLKIVYPEELDLTAPLYIKLFYRNIIFRLDPEDYFLVGEKIACDYPAEIRALEPRKGERYVLPYSSGMSLSLKRSERNRNGLISEIEVRMVDVSEKGIGIILSKANSDFLKRGDHFCIKAIDNRPLRHDVYGVVTYVAPKGYYLNRGDVRVGLSLKLPLEFDLFEYLKGKCKLVLGA